jgi:AcrR family transcriptional regulator
MQDIAARAGLSTGAIYLYYEGKDALIRAITQRNLETGRRMIEAVRADSTGPLSSMRALGATMISVFSDPGFEAATRLNIEMWPEMIRDKDRAAGARQEMSFWRQEVGKLLREAQEAGEITPDADPDTIAVLAICTWEGLRRWKLIDPSINEEILVSVVRPFLTAGTTEDWPGEDERKGSELLKGAPWTLPPSGDDSGAEEETE